MCVYVCMCACMCVCYMCMRPCCMCIYVCVFVYMCIYIRTCVHTMGGRQHQSILIGSGHMFNYWDLALTRETHGHKTCHVSFSHSNSLGASESISLCNILHQVYTPSLCGAIISPPRSRIPVHVSSVHRHPSVTGQLGTNDPENGCQLHTYMQLQV